MNVKFTSQGYEYRVVDALQFCDLYYGEHNTTDEYILSCIKAELGGNQFLCIRKDDVFYFLLSEKVKEDKLAEDLLFTHFAEHFPDATLLDSIYNCTIVAENLYILSKRIKNT